MQNNLRKNMNSPYGMVFYPKDLEYAPDALNELLSNLKTAGFIMNNKQIKKSAAFRIQLLP